MAWETEGFLFFLAPPQGNNLLRQNQKCISNIHVKLLKLWELKHTVIYVIVAVLTPFKSSIAMFLNASVSA